ncbi:MAG TPA: sigma-70 family RNA polymerase sigma factor [Oscillatoriaceae cyanobacterium M33_DOE_052]|nr:sigma-70 family RNA polymerase sigma factor [Oscillatoriaceae cyanobacterium M33_DOE_052]
MIFEALGYDACCDAIEVSDLELSPTSTEAIKGAYLIANQESGALQVFLLELEPRSWSSNKAVISRLTAIAKSLSQRPTYILIVATVDYRQLVLVSPIKTFDQQWNLKVSIAKMFIDLRDPSFYELNQLEKMAARTLNPQQLYRVQHQTLKQARKEKQELLDTDPMQWYLRIIGRIPLLNRQDEILLAQRVQRWLQLREHRNLLSSTLHREPTDLEWATSQGLSLSQLYDVISTGKYAQETLVCSNLRLVVSIAKKYQNRGLELLDLIQHGNLGLIKATKKFDPIKGYKFSTYATWWIKQFIIRGIHNDSRMIRLPIHVYQSLNKIKKATRHLTLNLNRPPNVEEIAAELKMSVQQVEYLRQINQLSQPSSLDAKLTDDLRLADLLYSNDDPTQWPEHQWIRDEIDEALSSLETREQKVIILRYGLNHKGKQSLQQIGYSHNMTRERVRQIQNNALKKLRIFYKVPQECQDVVDPATESQVGQTDSPKLPVSYTQPKYETKQHQTIWPRNSNPALSALAQFQELNANRLLYTNDDASLKQYLLKFIKSKAYQFYAEPKIIIYLVWNIDVNQTELYSIAQKQLEEWGILPQP